jgi:putative oxidoreductase
VVLEWDGGAGSAMPKLSESSALAVLRIVAGVLVFPHGVRKLIQGPVAAIGHQMTAHGFPASFAYVVTAGELAGIFLALGLYSRIAALAVAVTLWGVVIWVQLGLLTRVGTGPGVSLEYPLLLAVVATLLAALPPTRWSLDRRR